MTSLERMPALLNMTSVTAQFHARMMVVMVSGQTVLQVSASP